MKRSQYIEGLAKVGLWSGAAQAAAEFAERAGAIWDPEEPELPKRISIDGLFAHDGWCVTIPGASAIVCMIDGTWTSDVMPLRLAVMEAMVAAYNREREQEAMEAAHGAALDAGLSQILQDEMVPRAQVEKLERELAENADRLAMHSRAIGAAEARLEASPIGRAPIGKALLALLGTRNCRCLSEQDTILRTARKIAEADASAVLREVNEERWEEPRGPVQWPVALHRTLNPPRLLAEVSGVHNLRELTLTECEEAARRWQEEPRLRAEVERLRPFEDEALGLRDRIKAATLVLEGEDERNERAWRILTGKES